MMRTSSETGYGCRGLELAKIVNVSITDDLFLTAVCDTDAGRKIFIIDPTDYKAAINQRPLWLPSIRGIDKRPIAISKNRLDGAVIFQERFNGPEILVIFNMHSLFSLILVQLLDEGMSSRTDYQNQFQDMEFINGKSKSTLALLRNDGTLWLYDGTLNQDFKVNQLRIEDGELRCLE